MPAHMDELTPPVAAKADILSDPGVWRVSALSSDARTTRIEVDEPGWDGFRGSFIMFPPFSWMLNA